MTDNINTPPSDEEVDQFVAALTPEDLKELKRQQLVHRAVTRQQPQEIDWGSLSDADFQAAKRKLGIG